MDSKNYLARVRTVPETCPFYGLRKVLFYSVKKPLLLVLASRTRAIPVQKLSKPLCCIAL